MRPTELRELDAAGLAEHVATARRDLFGLRFQHATGELESSASLRTTRRDLARALTIARERGVDTTTTR